MNLKPTTTEDVNRKPLRLTRTRDLLSPTNDLQTATERAEQLADQLEEAVVVVGIRTNGKTTYLPVLESIVYSLEADEDVEIHFANTGEAR